MPSSEQQPHGPQRAQALERSSDDLVETPTVGYALEFVLARVFECEAAPCDQTFDGFRDQHLRPTRQGGDPGAGRHRNPGDLAVYAFTFAGS